MIDLPKREQQNMEFIPGQSMIIIPIMADNKLVAYRLMK